MSKTFFILGFFILYVFLFTGKVYSQEQKETTPTAMPKNIIGTEPISDLIGLFNIYYERKIGEKVTLSGTIGTGKILYFVDVNSAVNLTGKFFPNYAEDDFLLFYIFGSLGYLSVEYNNVKSRGMSTEGGLGLRVLVFDNVIIEAFGGITNSNSEKTKFEKIDGNSKRNVTIGGLGIGVGAKIGIAF